MIKTTMSKVPFLLKLVILLGAKPNAGNDKRDEDKEDAYSHPNDDHHPILFSRHPCVVIITCEDVHT